MAPRLALSLAPVLLVAGPAYGQDALRGKRLYLDAARLTGSGVSCIDCHTAYPPGLFGIGAGANRPDIVEQAVDSVPDMTPLRGRLTATDRADLAAYLGAPSVPSPAVALARADGSPIVGALQLGAVPIGGRTTQAVLVVNAGQLAFEVLSAPVIDGENAAELTLRDSTCVPGPLEPGEQCRLTLELAPVGAPGRRVARVVLEHDWVYGLAALAVLGEAAAPEPAPPAPEPGGCAVAGDGGSSPPVATLIALASLLLRARRGRGSM